MARITITPEISIYSDRPLEHPLVPGLHSIGGGHGVPRHDVARHLSNLPHDCTWIRSSTHYRGDTDLPRSEARLILAEQYAAHDITWLGWRE